MSRQPDDRDASPPRLTPAERLAVALELSAFGLQVKREQLRRKHPTATEEALDELLFAWRSAPR